MSKKVKVCGIRDADNLRMVLRFAPDMVGFIFYSLSKRHASVGHEVFEVDTGDVERVGVFVDWTVDQILDTVRECRLTAVQLSGSYELTTAAILKCAVPSLKIIWVVHPTGKADIAAAGNLGDSIDLVLFDTPGPQYGGHGVSFQWDLLDGYNGSKPFLIAGGVGFSNIDLLPEHDLLYGVDINSSVEESPGMKSETKLSEFFKSFRST